LKRIDKLHKRADKLVAKVNSEGLKTEGKIESENIKSINNSRNLPGNVTIREEYVKCGKSDCSKCKHGPYYYAYWKDDGGMLKKKYIGKYPPSIDKHKSSDNDCAANNTVIDPSSSTEDF
jgi:hypothetical protein